MAGADDTIRLGFSVDTADLPKAARATADLKRATDTYAVAATQAVSAAKMYNQAVNGYAVAAAPAISAAQLHAKAMTAAKLAAEQQAQANVRAAVSLATSGGVAAAAAAKMGGRGDIGRSMLEFSRLAEDAQFGIVGVLNNIPSLVMSIGGTAGLAGAISLVAVGSNLIYKNWDSISSLWQAGHTETEAERMERLGKATHKTAEEAKELAKYQKLQADIARVQGTQSRAQGEAASGINSAVGIVGGEKALADLTRVLMELKGVVEDRGGTLRKRAEELLGQAAGGNIRAADGIRSAFAGTRAGRASVTGGVLETGDAEARRKQLDAMDAEARAKAEAARQSKVDEAAGRLGSMMGGTYGLRSSGNDRTDAEAVKRDLIESGELTDVAQSIAADVWAKVRESMEQKVKDYAATHGLSLEAARGEMLGNADLAAMGPRAKAKEAMGPGREVFAQAQIQTNQAAEQARKAREGSIQGAISNATNSEGVVGDFLANARQNRFADRNYARKFSRLGMEGQLEETSRKNAQDDAVAKNLEQKRLVRLGINPARAAQIAEENVANARKQLNGQTGDVASESKELAGSTKDLNETMKRIERNGLIARFG